MKSNKSIEEMLKPLYSIVICNLCFITVLSAENLILDDSKIKEISSTVKLLQRPNLKVLKGVDKGNIYLLKVKASSKRGSRVFDTFIDKHTRNVYFGSAYDMEGKEILFPKDVKIIKEGVAFSYGSGKKELYLVTDPECPYCTKFEKDSQGKLDEYRVHVIFYPLSFHKKAPAMIEWIMQGKGDHEKRARLREIALKDSKEYMSLIKDDHKSFQYSESIQKSMERSLRAVKELGAKATPTTYDGSFNKVPWVELLKNSK